MEQHIITIADLPEMDHSYPPRGTDFEQHVITIDELPRLNDILEEERA